MKVPRMHTPLISNEVLVHPGKSHTCVQEFSFDAWRAKYQPMGLFHSLPPGCEADQWQLKDTLTGEILTPKPNLSIMQR